MSESSFPSPCMKVHLVRADVEAVERALDANAGTARTVTLRECSLQAVPAQLGTELTDLDVSFNDIADVGPLMAHTKLERLYLIHTPVRDLWPLRALCALRVLWLDSCRIVDVRPLAPLVTLQELRVEYNHIADVGPLASLQSLERLALSGNPVSDLTPLVHLRALRYLALSDTHCAATVPRALMQLDRLDDLDLSGSEWAVPPRFLARLKEDAVAELRLCLAALPESVVVAQPAVPPAQSPSLTSRLLLVPAAAVALLGWAAWRSQ